MKTKTKAAGSLLVARAALEQQQTAVTTTCAGHARDCPHARWLVPWRVADLLSSRRSGHRLAISRHTHTDRVLLWDPLFTATVFSFKNVTDVLTAARNMMRKGAAERREGEWWQRVTGQATD